MPNRLSIYNGALVTFLGQRRLANLTVDEQHRHDLDWVWTNGGVETCLENGLWNFATRTTESNYSSSVTPSFGYQYGHEIPSDYRGLVMLSSNGTFDEAYRRYRPEAGYWWTDLAVLYVSFVSSDELYGLNFDKWPMNFTRYVESYFAWKIAKRVTGADADEAEAAMKRARTTARGTDAREEPAIQQPRGSWSKARGAGYRTRSEQGA